MWLFSNFKVKAKHLAQIVISGIQIVGRAFARAVQNEIRASQQAAKSRSGESSSSSSHSAAASSLAGMTLQEAKQILNLDCIKNKEKLLEHYNHLFKVNDKSAGGSFYLQSKVVRAKERIDEELNQLQEKVGEKEVKKKQSDE
ncbi:hypothetical protein HELRODRAFT_180770 [Helobdella robusta]|uniref:Presequence translocated-associated motor subunit PAM16 n=1 Tax=Helobdella robusta TaxID=6412 RepID=T1FG94_HELRO|nr:hypothetical protein HELRODRAFT_180770 [Helobdella robusta]ESN93674.1 hypothetical protein HELRODRAFT_180770 [Helobdella robusta]